MHMETLDTEPSNRPGPLAGYAERAPGFARVLRQLESGTPTHVSGLRGSAFVLLVEALRARLGRSILVVCPDEESAEDTFSDFRTLSNGRPVLFPERDIFPHRHESRENLAVRGDRNECLVKIESGGAGVVVTSLLGYLEKTIPPSLLRSHRYAFSVGDTLDLEDFRERLVSLGYDAVAVVDEPGQFAVRGSIVDVFDPSWDYPARLELFDDDVESIRTFNLDSQRSIDNVRTVTILPAASVPFEEKSTAHLRRFLSERGYDKHTVEMIEEELLHSRHSFLWRRYAPALGMNGALLDYFREPPIIMFSDVSGCNAAHRGLAEEVAHVAARSDDDFPLLEIEDYIHPPDYHQRYGANTLWRWELGPLESSADQSEQAPDGTDQPTAPRSNPEAFPAPDGPAANVRFSVASHPSVVGNLDPLVRQIREDRREGTVVYIFSETPTQRDRLADMLEDDEELVHLPVGWITSGFVWREAGLALFTDHQIFKRSLPRPKKRKAKRRVQSIRYDQLQAGDFIVHVDYGIGRFVGLEKLGSDHGDAECLALRFHGGDRIFVPLEQMHLVEKYVGKEGLVPQVDRLSGTRWQKTKERARKAIEDIARDLLAVYAEREVMKGHAFGPDTQWQRELEASFPHEETPHQLRATAEIKTDMELEQPMDRLVCGDVGYGKTEVAIRAAFKAAVAGRQVAILVPTTLLAFQHQRTLLERMDRFPLKIAMLSRFVSAGEQKKVVAGIARGTVDIVVGTHRILSKDVVFNNLGLLIIDEEHRFGVRHKERLKQMTKSVDVLSLTATPIPRTLYMSLSGLRKISVIDTPPRNRHPVKTEVAVFDEETIRRAITEEVSRDGQVFFVHNRVRSIHSMHAFLERLVPGVRFAVAHGQMREHDLENVMLAFMEQKFDVLISTMIIESGLDLPNVNTIIINRADRFGLAQLYQLRGRVGRRERQASAWFLVPRQLSLSRIASKRLEAMGEFEDLGSGYRLAMRDLEIRGAGNVLGVEQHGHVAAIGFEMYCKMLKEAVDTMREGHVVDMPQCRVEAPYEYFVPVDYVSDADERMLIYKRLAGMSDPADVESMAEELADRFGAVPAQVHNLLDLTHVKLLAASQGVVLVRIREPGYRKRKPEALEHAAEVPDKPSVAPRGVRRSRVGSIRLARIAAMAEEGESGSKQTRSGVLTLEFAPERSFSPDQCGNLVETFGDRLLFKSGTTFGVTLEADGATPLLQDAKNLLQVAYFSTKMDVPSGPS